MENIILIDDDPANNFIVGHMIRMLSPASVVKSFVNPVAAFSHVSSEGAIDPKTIILLDLNMPVMNGWDFLEKFALLNIRCSIYILTSSLNQADKDRAGKYPFVNGYLIKPISEPDLKSVLKI